ncbi:protein-S-isoprenylcysteine O-methyltransferase Ste14 [Mariniflexile fucanivorans]|uniref:Protein-S-isoprenylcysteine O-methyltransferase Ste14 n=1 Tax=Mariniflexile fucanivorans TaxID=264023 RepID=A0A4R1RC71_9FLAO|nr:isoprenylcysteine carboxylmethyltransferase family protein [Mariniflexile fucanivorans]TCL63170.1 protein-S-isoprenylcysteine O-methyltransferase Ste14 [Mariniflexile fucanivorans]
MKIFLKYGSLIAFLISLLGLLYLIKNNSILSLNPIALIIQIASVGIMVWARITFGIKSFHVSSNATKEKLITNGPYKWWRHPIYASIIYFFLACLIAFPNYKTFIAVLIIVFSTYVRMLFEEKELIETFENYSEYSKKAKRIIPFIF